jgi:hypothetical protein
MGLGGGDYEAEQRDERWSDIVDIWRHMVKHQRHARSDTMHGGGEMLFRSQTGNCVLGHRELSWQATTPTGRCENKAILKYGLVAIQISENFPLASIDDLIDHTVHYLITVI